MTTTVEQRAKLSLGTSEEAIYRMVAKALPGRHPGGGTLLDVGCGGGQLWPLVSNQFDRYMGADVVRYEGFPDDSEFRTVDLDTARTPYPDACADVVVAVETIEHLENPRAFARELTRLTKPGGCIVFTTPNQLSLLSKLGLLFKNEFPAFRGTNYPAHITALLEVDIRRMAAECGWVDVAVAFSLRGRVPGVSWPWPGWLSTLLPRSFSDNVLVIGRTPNHV